MTRRTTVTAEVDDLLLLKEEARRRGLSLAAVLREAVAEKANEVRKTRPRPRFGLFSSNDGQSIAELMERDPDGPFSKPYRDE